MKDFKNKVVVITGGATGIGFSFAKQFIKEGAKVVIAGLRENRITEAVEKLQAEGGEAIGIVADISKIEAVEKLADFAWSTYGVVDVILNNAGIGKAQQSVIDVSQEDIEEVMNTNLHGVWNGIRVFGKRFREKTTPSAILAVGSENSHFVGLPYSNAYTVSKHGVHALMDLLREEVPPQVYVGLICPGLTNSEIGGGITFGMPTDDFTALCLQQIKAKQFYIVGHSYNMVRIQDRFEELQKAFEKYAPRTTGDENMDVRTLFARRKKTED